MEQAEQYAKYTVVSLHEDSARQELASSKLFYIPDQFPDAEFERKDRITDHEFQEVNAIAVNAHVENSSNPAAAMSCSTCHVAFESRGHQTQHFKLDWHRFNLKRRLNGFEGVDEDKFEEIAGDVSSISGSDEDTSESDMDEIANSPDLPWEKNVKSDGRNQRVFLRNENGKIFSVHCCLFHGKRDKPGDDSELQVKIAKFFGVCEKKWIVLMAGGGHFAGGIFKGESLLAHKTVHRYVVRAKQGGRQSGRDGSQSGRAPRSAGASLRRHNEASLAQEVRAILESWKDHFNNCERVFVRAPPKDRAIIFGSTSKTWSVIDKHDTRIVGIPFITKRATFREVQRVHTILSSIRCWPAGTPFQELSPKKFHSPIQLPQPSEPTSSHHPIPLLHKETPDRECSNGDHKSCSEDGSESNNDNADTSELVFSLENVTFGADLKHFEMTPIPKSVRTRKRKKEENAERMGGRQAELKSALYNACFHGNVEEVTQLLSQFNVLITESTPDTHSENTHRSEMQGKAWHENFGNVLSGLRYTKLEDSLLHVASRRGLGKMATSLMSFGADPSGKNAEGFVAYEVSADKNTRDEFRKFMASNPDAFDYQKARIPSALTEEMQTEKTNKMVEKRKEQRRARREKERAKKIEDREKARFLSLSDREKRALAAERRILAGNGKCVSRCVQCATDITGKVPFEYEDFRFCTLNCLQLHKKHNATPDTAS